MEPILTNSFGFTYLSVKKYFFRTKNLIWKPLKRSNLKFCMVNKNGIPYLLINSVLHVNHLKNYYLMLQI